MLNILRNAGQKVPKDIRTILREHKAVRPISEIKNGSYLNLGIFNIVQPHLLKQINNISSDIVIKLSFSIDGLPLGKNSKSQFWPILMSFINFPIFKKKIFPVGIFHSFNSKPGDINEYLGPFIQELNHILTHGIQINDKQINFEVAHIVADAPAKAFLLNVKNHNGYFACTSCEVEGEYLDRICFLDLSARLRTDSSFRLKSNPEYHKDGFSPLIDLPIDITKCVVLDYMHCLCQGVMKRLLDFWCVIGIMPRTYVRKVGGRPYQNYNVESLDKALNAILKTNISIRQAAEQFQVPRNEDESTTSIGTNASWTQAFVDILSDYRAQKDTPKKPRGKKINIEAGKSIRLEDINIDQPDDKVMDGDEIIEDIHLPSTSGTQTNYNNKNKKPRLIRDDEDYSEDDLATKDKEIHLEKMNENETINSKKTKLNDGDFIIVKYEVTKRNILYIGQISKVSGVNRKMG
ncbi:hypothetical protein ACI65C_006544 [Semiaphis heraclei]